MTGSFRPGWHGTQIYLPDPLYLWLKHRAIDEQTSLTELINRYLREARKRAEDQERVFTTRDNSHMI